MSTPYSILLVSANRYKEPYPVYPLGISYLKSYLRQRLPQYKVLVFDCNLGSMEDLSELIVHDQPRYVGISFRNADDVNSLRDNNFLTGYRQVVDTVRRATSVPLIIGGTGFSIFPQHFMDLMEADYGLAGEGEESLAQLIETLDAGKQPAAIDGLFVHGVDAGEYPRPRRHYVRSLSVDFEEEWVDYYWKYSGMLNIQTKRGCPYDCVYCTYPLIDGCVIRTLDPAKIVDDILRLRRQKGIDYLFFTDSVFNICPEYNQRLAEELIRREAKIRWGAYFAPSHLTREMLALYRRSGLTHIEFGTESFDDQVLEAYGKRFTFEDVLNSSEMALAEGIYYAHFLIFGGVGETMQTIGRSIENSKRIRSSVFMPYIGMRIYPHTRLQKIAVEEGVIAADDPLVEPKYYLCKDFDLERVRKMALETGKAWVFPDDNIDSQMTQFRLKRNKKGPLWEYLRKA